MTLPSGMALKGIVLCLGFLTLLAMVEHFGRWRRYRAHIRDLFDPGTASLPVPKSVPQRRRNTVPDQDDLSLMAIEVSSRLRSGMLLERAWALTWDRYGTEPFEGVDVAGVPLNLVKFLGVARNLPGWLRFVPGTSSPARSDQVSAVSALVGACRFSFLTGSPLAEVLEQVAESVAKTIRARRAQDQAFAGPKLSANVLTALPLVAILGGELLGAGSLGWLLGGGIGSICAVGGATLLIAGHGVNRRMIDAARKRAHQEIQATLLCDLARAGLRSGLAIPAVLSALGRSQGEPGLERVAKELVMGSEWIESWEPIPAQAQILFRGLQPGWEEGVSPLALLERMVSQSRESRVAQAEQDAAKLAVKLVVPLGIFMLPAFILLGIAPVVVALIGGQLGL